MTSAPSWFVLLAQVFRTEAWWVEVENYTACEM